MKYAMPSKGNRGLNDELAYHFGRAPYFTIWDEETNEIEIVENRSDHFGGKGLPAEFLKQHCDALICGGIGSRAVALCSQIGLRLFVGAEGMISKVISDFKEGKIREATRDDGCKH